MFHHDLTHTGYSSSTAPNTNQTLWKFNTGGPVDSLAVVGCVVYVGSDDHLVYAFGSSPSAQTYSMPSPIVLLLFIMATLLGVGLLAVALYRRKHQI